MHNLFHVWFMFQELELLKKNARSEKEHLEKTLKQRKSDAETKISKIFKSGSKANTAK